MNFREVKMEIAVPIFFAMVCSIFLCALFAAKSGFLGSTAEVPEEICYEEEQEDIAKFFSHSEKEEDFILKLYRDMDYQEWVIDFFAGLCSSREIAWAILDNADQYEVPPALAFALGWEESRFNPGAVNRGNHDGSVDRGLFQLNSYSFPHLEISSFFDVGINSRYGVSHLRHCLNSSNNEIVALAMYNAGTGRVKNHGTPKVTLDYVHRILENRSKIEKRFQNRLIKEDETRITEKAPEQLSGAFLALF